MEVIILDTIKQWNNAAEIFMETQEKSKYAEIN